MKANWQQIPLGEVISHRKEFIEINDLEKYKRCRVKIHAQGIVLRDEVSGIEIKTKRQQVCRVGEFLVAEIDAKVGGYGIVPENLNNSIVSSHYFLFEINENLLNRKFLDFVTRTKSFSEQINAQGSTNYAAIRPKEVLGYKIPLPPIEEQQRIVARIDELAGKIEEARGLREEIFRDSQRLFQTTTNNIFKADGRTSVGDFATIQSGYAFKSHWFAENGIPLVRNVNIGHGRIVWNQTVYIPEDRKNEFGRFELKAGDILISLDRPIISTGVKVARVLERDLPSLLLQRVGRVQFQSKEVYPEYFLKWLQSFSFISAIDPGRSNGVPHISQKDIEKIKFSLPPIEEQKQIVAYLDGLQAKVEAVKKLQAETQAELDALMPSILDKAFKGEL